MEYSNAAIWVRDGSAQSLKADEIQWDSTDIQLDHSCLRQLVRKQVLHALMRHFEPLNRNDFYALDRLHKVKDSSSANICQMGVFVKIETLNQDIVTKSCLDYLESVHEEEQLLVCEASIHQA